MVLPTSASASCCKLHSRLPPRPGERLTNSRPDVGNKAGSACQAHPESEKRFASRRQLVLYSRLAATRRWQPEQMCAEAWPQASLLGLLRQVGVLPDDLLRERGLPIQPLPTPPLADA